jgi:serine/threonine protein kinase
MSDDRLPDGTIFWPYQIQGLIASGGMGQVYAARHQIYGHIVALKVLHAVLHEDPDWRHRFDFEGLVGEGLKHPHVLSARERVHFGQRIALVLDLIPGGQTLEKVLSREYKNGMDCRVAIDLFLNLLGGMEYLHQRGIVHGDLKPENVMIKGDYRQPRGWVPMVTDFGTVALISRPVEIEGRPAVVATPRYASPEHLYGVDKIDVRSDIYCLGLLFHYILSGRHASNAQNVREAAERVSMPVPVVYLMGVPKDLVDVFRRMVALKPTERYESVQAVALAIRAARDRLGYTDLAEDNDIGADLATVEIEGRPEAQREPTANSQMPTTNNHSGVGRFRGGTPLPEVSRTPVYATPTGDDDASARPALRDSAPISHAGQSGIAPTLSDGPGPVVFVLGGLASLLAIAAAIALAVVMA